MKRLVSKPMKAKKEKPVKKAKPARKEVPAKKDDQHRSEDQWFMELDQNIVPKMAVVPFMKQWKRDWWRKDPPGCVAPTRERRWTVSLSAGPKLVTEVWIPMRETRPVRATSSGPRMDPSGALETKMVVSTGIPMGRVDAVLNNGNASVAPAAGE